MDTLGESSSEEAQVRREEWPEYHLTLFDNDVISFCPRVSFLQLTHVVLSVGRSRSNDARRICPKIRPA